MLPNLLIIDQSIIECIYMYVELKIQCENDIQLLSYLLYL